MQEPVEPMEQLKPIANINIENGALEFNNVEFKYDVKRFLIMYHFVYLRVTLVLLLVLQVLGKYYFNLIERMYDIDNGDITYGNESIYDIPITNWRSKIGYVMQSNSMMTGTIRDNILYGINRNVSDEELIKYAKLANCHDFYYAI